MDQIGERTDLSNFGGRRSEAGERNSLLKKKLSRSTTFFGRKAALQKVKRTCWRGELILRVVVQRAKQASVTVDGKVVGQIDFGVVLLVGVTHKDDKSDAAYLADKIVHLRIFEDEHGKMNKSLLDVGGQALSVSQFTLYGDVRKGRRPSFAAAAKPDQAETLYRHFNDLLSEKIAVETGIFGAMMDVKFINDGPVTLLLESP